MLYIHAFLLALVGLLASGGVHAQYNPHVAGAPFIPLPYDYFETAGRLKVMQPIGQLTLPGGKRLFDNADLDTDGGSGVRVKGGAEVRNPSGNPVKVDVSSRLPNNTVGGALGRATGKILKSLSGPLGIGVAIWELYKELNFDLAKDVGGNPVVRKIDTTVCTVAPCYDYVITTADGTGVTSGYKSTKLLAASAFATAYNAYPGYGTYLVSLNECGSNECYFELRYDSDGSLANPRRVQSVESRSIPAQSTAYLPSSEQEFLDAVAAKSGWPSSSAISRALADAVAATGDKLVSGSPTVSGPATSPGTTTTTNDPVNNTTTINTTTHNHTYAGDTITNTTINNTTTTNNTTGAVTTNTTTTGGSAPAPAPIDTCGMPGKPACQIDETGTPAYDPEKLKLDKTTLDTASATQRDTIKGTADKGMFSSWSTFFSLPSLRACELVEMPAYMGQQIASMNVCPGAEWLRGLMGFVWAAAGFAFCFATVREAI